MWLKIAMITIVGGVIGYITNVLAVKLLFRPFEPIKIPIINKEIVGLIPKRRKDIARSIAEMVDEELIDLDIMLGSMVKEEDKEELISVLKERVSSILEEKMFFLPSPMFHKLNEYIDEIIEQEAVTLIDEGKDKMIEKAKERIDVKELVEEKINSLNLVEIEGMILKIASKELKHIEDLGLILGAVIGFIQGIVVTFL